METIKACVTAGWLFAAATISTSISVAQGNTENSALLPEHESIKTALKEKNALGSTICELAVERFHANAAKTNNWVLGIDFHAIDITKYTDGTNTVILLPESAEEADGVKSFVTAYDTCVLRAADEAARRGDLAAADRTYKLLQRFAPRGFYPRELEQRIKLIEEYKDSKTNDLAKQLRLLEPTYDLFAFIAGMETQPALRVRDLFNPGERQPEEKSALEQGREDR